MSGKRDRHGNPLSGKVHNAERKRWVKLVARGGVACWRCQKPIPAGSGWDLGHVDEDGRRLGYPYRHPEQIGCNRAEPFRKLHRQANGNQNQTYKPPPEDQTYMMSRHWVGAGFNPRCRECRKQGSACAEGLAIIEWEKAHPLG